MTTGDSLYELFGVQPTCTDDELRRGYHRALQEHHPDKNPHQIEAATAKTKGLNIAYAELKKRRSNQSASSQESGGEHDFSIAADDIGFSIRFSFGRKVDLEDIAKRKTTFRGEWERFQKNHSDPECALRFVHAAFRAEQPDSVKNLLLNPLLIDSGPFLLSLAKPEDACDTLIRWAEILQDNEHAEEAIQILEDALATGQALPSLAEELRRLHYSWEQYRDPTTGTKANPEVRIKHLGRILELGFEYDYIHKCLAVAYHDLGDDGQARVHLSRAYELNPQLSGAVRISRALGFPQPTESTSQRAQSRRKYKYSNPEQIPSSTQIHEWAQNGNWDAVVAFANPNDYSPRILPRARERLRQIARSLEKFRGTEAIEALTNLLYFTYYWDVSEAAMTSLSKIGDRHTLDLLTEFEQSLSKIDDTEMLDLQAEFEARNSRLEAHLEACVSYLRARVDHQLPVARTMASPEELLAQAERAYEGRDYGEARLLLENLVANIEPSHSLHSHATILLARSCAKMHDVKTAIELTRLVITGFPQESWREIASDIASWLWEALFSEEYTPINDEDYRLALGIHLELALMAKDPDEILWNLRRLTRWLELLGAGDIIQWVRQSVRTEAPGTWYVEQDNREQYVRDVRLTQHMKSFLISFGERVRTDATSKLKQVMEGLHSLENAEHLLDNH